MKVSKTVTPLGAKVERFEQRVTRDVDVIMTITARSKGKRTANFGVMRQGVKDGHVGQITQRGRESSLPETAAMFRERALFAFGRIAERQARREQAVTS